MALRKVGIKPGKASGKPQGNPLGKLHRHAIARVVDVPKAATGFPNTTPGSAEKPVIMKKDDR